MVGISGVLPGRDAEDIIVDNIPLGRSNVVRRELINRARGKRAAMDLRSLAQLQTEAVNPQTVRIDQLSTLEMCTVINNEDHRVAESVTPFLPQIADAIDALAPRVRKGGRVIYVGAGTSGRLGILDASEIPPTFAAPHSQFVGLIAGGDAAIRRAQEGAEDSIVEGEADMAALDLNSEVDSVIGIAASGRTPYVMGCLAFAKRIGCITIGVVCASPSAMGQSRDVDFLISPLPGPEVVTGSTRLKAGTATKLVLNMLSTGTMIQIGKTYGNMMVDLVASNLKLKQRSRNILRRLSTTCNSKSDEDLDAVLIQCNGSVKLALLVSETGLPMEQCRSNLECAGGVLAKVLQKPVIPGVATKTQCKERQFVLCIDGGGTKCAAVVVDHTGATVGRGIAGPCNLTDGHGIEEVITTLTAATRIALEDHKDDLQSCFKSVWIGLAGIDRNGFRELLMSKVCELFGLTVGNIRVTNDVDLLAAAASHHPDSRSAIVLIAGTGSVAMRYNRDPDSQEYIRVTRSGGWGHILGDEGSGYAIGLMAIKHTLTVLEEIRLGYSSQSLGKLEQAVLQHLGCGIAGEDIDLVSEILIRHQNQSVKTRIARVAEVVLRLIGEDKMAADIIQGQVESLVSGTLKRLVHPQSPGYVSRAETVLILSGGILNNDAYQTLLLNTLQRHKLPFGYVENVSDAALVGAKYLVSILSDSVY